MIELVCDIGVVLLSTVIKKMKSSYNPEGLKQFHVDGPFIISILEKTTGIILFLGEVSNL